MHILNKDFRKGIVNVKIESPEDLWFLSQIIEPGDLVRGRTERKINLGGEGEKAKIIKKVVTVTLKVEKVEFSDSLKILGIITEDHEDIPKGSHQSILLNEQDTLSIIKEEWLGFQKEKLSESTEQKTSILLLAFDREEAIFGLLTNKGLEVLTNKKGTVSKKDQEEVKGNFYKELALDLTAYDQRFNPEHIIVASPSFWKEYLLKEIKNAKIITASCSDVSINALKEIMKRPELHNALSKSRASLEEQKMQLLLENIAKENAFYGLKETEECICMGNVQTLIVSTDFIKQTREKNTYKRLEELMKKTEKLQGDVFIITHHQLDGLGGIAGIKRWKH
jgi:protein pelota